MNRIIDIIKNLAYDSKWGSIKRDLVVDAATKFGFDKASIETCINDLIENKDIAVTKNREIKWLGYKPRKIRNSFIYN